MAIFRREPTNEGIKCRWGRQKSQFRAYIWLHYVLSTLRPAKHYQHSAAEPQSHKLRHLSLVVSGAVLIVWDDDEMFMTRSLNFTSNITTEQHLIACSDKSVAYVTNNKRLCSTFCTIKANYWQKQSILFATAELLTVSVVFKGFFYAHRHSLLFFVITAVRCDA